MKVAFIGFEYDFFPAAAKTAIDNVSHNKKIDVALWSSRKGVEKRVQEFFPDSYFLDAGRLMHGDWIYLGKVIGTIPDKLDSQKKLYLKDTEVIDCAYTFMRYNPHMSKKTALEKKSFYEVGLNLCAKLIIFFKIDILFFPSPPHNIFDLLMFFSARKLKLMPSLTFARPGFSDLVYVRAFVKSKFENIKLNNIIYGEKVNNYTSDMNLKDINNYYQSRDRNKDNFLISYQDKKKLNSIPSIPNYPFYRTNVGHFLNNHSNNSIFFKKYIVIFDRSYLKIWGYVGKLYRAINKVRYSKNIIDIDDDYVLFSLHYHPEQTSCPSSYSSPFESDLLVSLAKKFPNMDIVAKEHPSMLKNKSGLNYMRYRDSDFFSIFNKFHTVKYVSDVSFSDYTKLVEKAKFVVTISGTIVIESSILKTPCVHLGFSWSHGAPGLLTVDSVDEIEVDKVIDLKNDLLNLKVEELPHIFYNNLERYKPIRAYVGGFHETFIDDYIKLSTEAMERLINISLVLYENN